MTSTPDLVVRLVEALEEAHSLAKGTRVKLGVGSAVSGSTGLRRIEEITGDALEEAKGSA